MLRKQSPWILAGLLALVGTLGVSQAGHSKGLPHRFSPGALDKSPVRATDPLSGTTWSAWAYRSGGEYSIALSARAAGGLWSEPVFIGLDDKLNQTDPAILVDGSGSFYLAYAVKETGAIHVSALYVGRSDWFDPQQVSRTEERASSPALSVVGNRLVLAYVGDRRQVGILDWALLPPRAFTPDGIQEGPDGFPLPSKSVPPVEGDFPDEDKAPAGTFGKKGPGGSSDPPGGA